MSPNKPLTEIMGILWLSALPSMLRIRSKRRVPKYPLHWPEEPPSKNNSSEGFLLKSLWLWDLYDAFAWDGQPEAAPIRQEDYQQILRKSHQRDPYLVEILSAPAEKIISSMDSRGTSINGCSNSWWMSSAMANFIRERSDISPLCSNYFKDPKLTPDFSLNFFCESFLRFRI